MPIGISEAVYSQQKNLPPSVGRLKSLDVIEAIDDEMRALIMHTGRTSRPSCHRSNNRIIDVPATD
jgi:hypothetical protein